MSHVHDVRSPAMGEATLLFTSEKRISTMFALLPEAIQSRINPLRHIRRSISLGNLGSVTRPHRDSPRRSRPLSEGCLVPLESSQDIQVSADLDSASNDMSEISGVDGQLRIQQNSNGKTAMRPQLDARSKYARQGELQSQPKHHTDVLILDAAQAQILSVSHLPAMASLRTGTTPPSRGARSSTDSPTCSRASPKI
jgi:hypothetical protein